MRCGHIHDCPLFRAFSMRATLGVWKAMYCEGHFEGCARFQLAAKGEPAPGNLLPNGKLLAVPLDHRG